MKKLTLILAFIGMITLNSCSNDDDIDNDTISSVIEYTGVNFNAAGDYGVFLNYPQIFSSDMVLVYRLSGVTPQGADVWKLLPESFYFDDGTLDFKYNFDFTTTEANVFLDGNDLGTIDNSFLSNQIFRVVIIPAAFVNKSAVASDFSDYDKVLKTYNIDGNNIKKIKYSK